MIDQIIAGKALYIDEGWLLFEIPAIKTVDLGINLELSTHYPVL